MTIRGGFSDEAKLLCLTSLSSWTEAERADMKRLAAGPLNRTALAELAEINAVSTKLSRTLPGLLPSADNIAAEIAAINERRAGWGWRFLDAFADAGIEVILLKGFQFAATIYADAAYKKMNDVDILIRYADAAKACEILRALGFENLKGLYGKNELSTKSHHTPAFASADLDCIVGLHWGLISPKAPWKPDIDGIWQRKVAIAGTRVFAMSPEDNVLHLAVHLPYYKTGLRELADVYNVIREAKGGFDWDAFDAHVRTAGAEDPVYRVVKLADALVSVGIPTVLEARWRAGSLPSTVRDTDARCAHPTQLLRSRSVMAGKIEKQYVIFFRSRNLRERAATWFRMHRMLALPDTDEVDRLSPTGFSQGARLRAPFQLWSALARDHGHLAMVGMEVVNASLLVVSLLTLPWSWNGIRFAQRPEAPLMARLE